MSKVETRRRTCVRRRARNIATGCAASGAAASTVAATQLALLVVFLVLWEVAAPGADHQSAVHQLSLGAVADLPRPAEGHAAAGRASSPTPGRPCWRP